MRIYAVYLRVVLILLSIILVYGFNLPYEIIDLASSVCVEK
jgi:hypothetical protein